MPNLSGLGDLAPSHTADRLRIKFAGDGVMSLNNITTADFDMDGLIF